MLILYDGIFVTVDKEGHIYQNAAIVIEKNRIREIGSAKEILEKYKDNDCSKISCKGKAVFPGFVNTHIHTAQSIVRGVAEDLGRAPSYTPTVPQGDDLSDEESYVFSLLGAATALRFGSTTINDNYAHAMINAKAFETLGLRAVVSERVHDMVFSKLAEGCYEQDVSLGEALLEKNIQLLEKYSDQSGRITACLGPHAPDTCSRELLERIAKLYEKYEVPITTHLAQSSMEVKRVQDVYGVSSTKLLEECGLVNKHLMAAHGVFLQDEEIAILRKNDAQIVHIPEGNAKAGSIARIQYMKEQGLNVSIGTDNGAANMIENMRMALVAGRILNHCVTSPSSEEMLKMATIQGARALHRDSEIGSIEAGKLADLVVIDYDRLHLTPCTNVVGNLVHLGLGNDVDMVIVDGEIVVRDGKVLNIEEKEVMQDARRIAELKWLHSSPDLNQKYTYVF